MLSKARFKFKNELKSSVTVDHLISEIKQLLNETNIKIFPINSGEQSNCFYIQLYNNERFLKTNKYKTGQLNLLRDNEILNAIYGERTDAKFLQSNSLKTRSWLNIKKLDSIQELSPPEIKNIVNYFEDCINNNNHINNLVPIDDNIKLLIAMAHDALQLLVEKQFISNKIQNKLKKYINVVQINEKYFKKQICHGDLSPANILSDIYGPIVIDWEDAFWGFPGYDYLYWLTFISNRKWLESKVFGFTEYGKEIEIAILLIIVLVKSAISVHNGSFVNNSISFEKRIFDIINLE